MQPRVPGAAPSLWTPAARCWYPAVVPGNAIARVFEDRVLLRGDNRKRLDRLTGGSTRCVTTPRGDVRICARPSSHGPRVLFGVDGPNAIEHYAELLQALEDKADVVLFEPPGTGGSVPAPGFDFALDSFADTTEHLLTEFGPRTLVFPCWLGLVAQRVARRSPHLAPRVVLPQTVGVEDFSRWADRVDRRRLLRTPIVGQALVAVRPGDVVRGWYRASVGHAHRREPFAETALRVIGGGGVFCLASLMQALEAELKPGHGLGAALPVPAVVPWGAQDRSHAKSDPLQALSGAEVVTFADCGHCPELEEPDRFATWLLGWLSEHEQA